MNEETLVNRIESRPRLTSMMILCGIVGASAAAAVSAATPDEPLTLVVRYHQDSLATDDGAKALYHRLEKAAEQVCPAGFSGSPILSGAVVQCRQQSIARAVQQINNPRLGAVYSTNSKKG